MKRSIAFFDFDGTITSKDTMLELIKFHFGNFKFIKGMIYVLPWIAGMKTKLVSHQTAKEKLLSYFFKGMSEEKFIHICNDFSKKILPGLIRESAIQKIDEYQKNKIPVVVVTASAEHWVNEWCRASNVACIASQMEVINGLLTGKLIGNNCNYEEKVVRIKNNYSLENYDEIHCYGDSPGDAKMLQQATHAFYKSLN